MANEIFIWVSPRWGLIFIYQLPTLFGFASQPRHAKPVRVGAPVARLQGGLTHIAPALDDHLRIRSMNLRVIS